jgi:hypothetical protein
MKMFLRIAIIAVVVIALLVAAVAAWAYYAVGMQRMLNDRSPEAVSCHAEAKAKYPADWIETDKSPDGKITTRVNRNNNNYWAHYRRCRYGPLGRYFM